MKHSILRYLLVVALISGVVDYMVNIQHGTPQPKRTAVLLENSPTPTEMLHRSIFDDGKRISYQIVSASTGQVRLVTNLPVATDSASAKHQHACEAITNAGFYTKEKTPLGLFRIGVHEYAPAIQNSTVDGFIYETTDNQIMISYSLDVPIGAFALQSGPIVRTQNTPRPLSMNVDEYARRVVAAISNTHSVSFIVLYDAESTYSGPLLARVPYIIDAINTVEHHQWTDAINLDGGSASVFISRDTTLSELVPAGGFFCITQ